MVTDFQNREKDDVDELMYSYEVLGNEVPKELNRENYDHDREKCKKLNLGLKAFRIRPSTYPR